MEGQTIAKIFLPLLQHCSTNFTVAIMKELELLGFVSEIKECVIKGVLFHQDFAQDSKCAKSISP